jgi:hypothetical protein
LLLRDAYELISYSFRWVTKRPHSHYYCVPPLLKRGSVIPAVFIYERTAILTIDKLTFWATVEPPKDDGVIPGFSSRAFSPNIKLEQIHASPLYLNEYRKGLYLKAPGYQWIL